jgi:hypothetical protein
VPRIERVEDDGSALLDLDDQAGLAALGALDQGQVHVEKEAKRQQAQARQAHARIVGADHIARCASPTSRKMSAVLVLLVAAHLDAFELVGRFEGWVGRKLRQRRCLGRVRRFPLGWRFIPNGKRWTANREHDESKGEAHGPPRF